MLTARNWAIGYYIVEFEQNGKERAEYGTALLTRLSASLNIKGLDRQMLNTCRIFYQKYPKMCETVSRRLKVADSSVKPIELKVDKFRYEHFGQLNSYVSYYKDCEMTEGDNPPIGILLCTEKGEKMVEYVLNGMDEQVFVSTYMLHLPDKKQLEDFLAREMKEMGV